MDETPKITERQRGLLLVLPDQPGDGKLCKGPKLRIAENLERLGYAQRVGSGFFNGGKFTRTAAGRAKLVELGDLVGLPGLRRLAAVQLGGEIEAVRACPSCAAEREQGRDLPFARAFLTFTRHKLSVLMKCAQDDLTPAKIRDYLRTAPRRDLARAASGVHSDREDALRYARTMGPAVVLAPTGKISHVSEQRDPVLDRAAERETAEFGEAMRLRTQDTAISAARRASQEAPRVALADGEELTAAIKRYARRHNEYARTVRNNTDLRGAAIREWLADHPHLPAYR